MLPKDMDYERLCFRARLSGVRAFSGSLCSRFGPYIRTVAPLYRVG